MPVLGSRFGKGYSPAGVAHPAAAAGDPGCGPLTRTTLGKSAALPFASGAQSPGGDEAGKKDSSTSWGQAEAGRGSGTRSASASQVCQAQAVSSNTPKASLPPSPPQTWLQGTEQCQSASRPPPSSHASSPLSDFSPTSATSGFQVQYQQSPWGPQPPPSYSMGN